MKKKIFALAMAMTMMLALAACGPKDAPAASGSGSGSAADGSNPAAVQTIEAGKLTVSTNAAFPPYEMVAGNGDLIGIDMEVAAKKETCKKR